MIDTLIKAARKMKHIGFIYSIKEHYTTYSMVKEANLPNIFLKTFVPQKELLNDERVKAFVTHGGANSLLESLYYGKVILGFPIAVDQFGGCYRAEKMGVGISF